MAWQPSAAEERWLALAARRRGLRQVPLLVARSGGWRSVGFWTRCALFFIGQVATGTMVRLFSLLHVPRPLLAAGLASVAVAEWLIRRRRLVAAGIEEVLEAAGLLLVVIDVLTHVGGRSEVAAALLVAAAFAAAGLRLLNPLFTTLAALALSFALDLAIARAPAASGQAAATAASLGCLLVALLALLAGATSLQRPSHDRMLDWLVVAMPLAAYLWSAGGRNGFAAVDYLQRHAPAQLLTPLLPLAFALVALAVGVHRRTHAPLLAFMTCTACVAYELRGVAHWPPEAWLIAWGSTALALAVALDRYLRRPRRGFSSRQLSDGAGALDLLELAGAARLTPQAAPQPARGMTPGGGGFGGGGASGDY